MKDRLIKPSDVIFTAAVVAACILVWFFTLPRGGGSAAVVRMDGQIMARLPLSKDTEYEIKGAYTNLLQIKDGGARVICANCPGRQCERMGVASSTGAAIVCAPNHVSVTIEGGAGVDAVTG